MEPDLAAFLLEDKGMACLGRTQQKFMQRGTEKHYTAATARTGAPEKPWSLMGKAIR